MPNWRNSVDIKKHFTEEADDSTVKLIIGQLVPKLKIILNKERRRISNESVNAVHPYMLEGLTDIIDDFYNIKDGIESGANPKEFYDFDNWTDVFNTTLVELYNIGDMNVMDSKGNITNDKFIWIG